jgi:uncharacterized membrane protein YidH (DUF202 family)
MDQALLVHAVGAPVGFGLIAFNYFSQFHFHAVLVGNSAWGNQALSIVVAVIGWTTLVRGIAMLLVTPDQERKLIDYWRRDITYYTSVGIVLVLGLYLARAGFAG